MKKLRLTINFRMFFGILSILISVGIIGFNVFNITNIKDDIHHNFISVYEFSGNVKDLRADLSKIPTTIYEYNLNSSDNEGRQYSRILSDINNKLIELSNSITDDDQKMIISDLKKIMKEFPSKIEENESFEHDQAESIDKKTDYFIGEHILDHSKLLDKYISKIEEDNRIELDLLSQEAEEQKQRLLWWIVFGTVLCSTMALITALIMAFTVTKPLKKIIKVIDDISKGNLSTTINNNTLKANDEIGDLARAFERIIISLKLAIRKTNEK